MEIEGKVEGRGVCGRDGSEGRGGEWYETYHHHHHYIITIIIIISLPEFIKIPSPKSPLDINLSGGEETNLTFALPKEPWGIRVYFYSGSESAGTELSYTPNNTQGQYWLEVRCDGHPPDSNSIFLPPVKSTSPPPRLYSLQVSCCVQYK